MLYTDPSGEIVFAPWDLIKSGSSFKNLYDVVRCSSFENEYLEEPNIWGMVAAGVALTSGIVVVEVFLLIPAETAMVPVIGTFPLVGVPMEAVLVATSLFLIDADVAYWSYVYRTYQAGEKQDFIWSPPWSF